MSQQSQSALAKCRGSLMRRRHGTESFSVNATSLRSNPHQYSPAWLASCPLNRQGVQPYLPLVMLKIFFELPVGLEVHHRPRIFLAEGFEGILYANNSNPRDCIVATFAGPIAEYRATREMRNIETDVRNIALCCRELLGHKNTFVENECNYRPLRLPPLKLTSLPARFWPDVFVPSQLPWQRFVQSMLLHVIMVVALGGLLEFGFSQPQLRHSQLRFNKSDVIYYSPSDYLPSFKRVTGPSQSRRTQRPALVKQPVSVSRESGSRTPASVTSPSIKLNEELRLARIIAWNSAIPAVPFTAAMRSQRNMPTVSASAIAPPPDISEVSPSRHLTPATPVVIEPAPLPRDRAVNCTRS